MPYCPKCRDEFEDWVKVCPDCNVTLVDELPEMSVSNGHEQTDVRSMKRRRIIGWVLFALGIPLFFIGGAVSKEITGQFTLIIFPTALLMGGGWILAHPKRKDGKS